MPPLPFSPVKFSGEIDRVSASANRQRFAIPTPMPFHIPLESMRRAAFLRGVNVGGHAKVAWGPFGATQIPFYRQFGD
jgi:hypothetical protein